MAEPRKIKTRVIQKHAQAAVWENTQFTPLEGEFIVFDKDANNPNPRVKIGDGSRDVNELPFLAAGTAEHADEATHATTADAADQSDKLTTARKISIVGDISGSTEFDGSKDVSIATELTGTFTYTPSGSVAAPNITLKGNLSNKVLTISATASEPKFTGNEGTVDYNT